MPSAPTLSSVSTKQRFGILGVLAGDRGDRSPRCSGWRRNRAGSRPRWRAAPRVYLCFSFAGWPRKCSSNSMMKVPVPVAGSRISTSRSIRLRAEVLFAQPVGRLDHEAHDLVGRVDHAEPVGGLRVVDLVEVLVDDLEEGLLLVVAGDLRGGGRDGRVIGLQRARASAYLVLPVKNVASSLYSSARDVVVFVESGLSGTPWRRFPR